jgi:hypothetical protein
MRSRDRPHRLEHGHTSYAKVEATDTCRECGGKLESPVPHHADFHQTCGPCLETIALREAYRPRTREEAAADERWQAWLRAKFPPDGCMVRRKAS